MEKFKKYLGLLDVPSGVILGLFTLIIIGVCVHAYATKAELPASVVTIYQFVVGSFAGSKSIKTIWGKEQSDKNGTGTSGQSQP